MTQDLATLSKFLSYVLRHRPDSIGLTLDVQGWAGIDELIGLANRHGHTFDYSHLFTVVSHNDKQRFCFSEDGLKIRANQGHSFTVDLALTAKQPPEVLYHGTATRFLTAILAEGLKSQGRQQVHLSHEKATAIRVGQRHGKPVVLEVAAAIMQLQGYVFYLSDNQVWLTDSVPAKYLTVL